MSEAAEQQDFQCGIGEIIRIAAAVADRSGYGPDRLGPGYAKFKDRSIMRFFLWDKGTIELQAFPVQGGVNVTFCFANRGFGPINTGRVRKQLGKFVTEVEAEIARRPPARFPA